jgi:hypothetical protein
MAGLGQSAKCRAHAVQADIPYVVLVSGMPKVTVRLAPAVKRRLATLARKIEPGAETATAHPMLRLKSGTKLVRPLGRQDAHRSRARERF